MVTNAEALAEFFRASISQRVDIVMLGDSNQLFNSDGWDHGWGRAAAARFGMYATGLVSAGENDGNGAGAGYQYQGFSTLFTGLFSYSGAPAELDLFLQPGIEMYPLNYLFLPKGQVGGGFVNLGLTLSAGCPIGPEGALRFEVTYGTFPGELGWFQPSVRYSTPPYAVLSEVHRISTERPPGAPAVWTLTMDIPGGERAAPLTFRLTPWGSDMLGPVILYTMRVENLDRPVGAAVHTLYARGGMSVRDMAQGLQLASDDYLSLYFREVRKLQGPRKHVLIRLNSGLNDRNETEPSLGPLRILNGRSAAAYGDNLQAVIDRLAEIWARNQWDPRELFFLFTVSHPVGFPDDPSLVAYRLAAAEVARANPRTAAIDPLCLTSSAEMFARGWYQLGGMDRNHLTRSAYEALSERELAAAEGEFAWRDLNGDRCLDAEDLYAWDQAPVDFDSNGAADAKDRQRLAHAVRFNEAQDLVPRCHGDANHDSQVTFADLTAVLAAFGQSLQNGPAISGDADHDGDIDFADITAVLGSFGKPCL